MLRADGFGTKDRGIWKGIIFGFVFIFYFLVICICDNLDTITHKFKTKITLKTAHAL